MSLVTLLLPTDDVNVDGDIISLTDDIVTSLTYIVKKTNQF